VYSRAPSSMFATPSGLSQLDPCASDGGGVAWKTNTSEDSEPSSQAGSVTSRMGMTQRISPIGPLCGSGGVIETTMQSCRRGIADEKNKKKKIKTEEGGERGCEVMNGYGTNLDPEPCSFEASNRHLRIDVDFPSEREPLQAITLIITNRKIKYNG
jgi:hypothetical protein